MRAGSSLLLLIPGLLMHACSGDSSAVFADRAAASGLDFVHFNGMSGELYFVEMMGSGAGMFDYDNDGDLDLYLVQGHLLGASETLLPPLQAPPIIDRLYRNDSDDSGLRFVDVTEASGIEAGAYGMGIACADIDNDGNTDLYLSNFGTNQLWRNLGDGTFVDITEKS
ncbi:MAG: VCBS repeat-containing protein, partial [Gammaproteobacteria bacterium]|nr:VCBS repeat-containing protein [Gammaproteobacteria bacterium]